MLSNLRVLILTNAINLWKGGHVRNIHFLAQALVKQGVEVEVFTYQVDEAIYKHASYKIHKCNLSHYTHISFAHAARQFVITNGTHFSILHANGPIGFLISGMSKRQRPPLIVHFRASTWRIVKAILYDKLAWKSQQYKTIRSILGHLMEWGLDCYSLRYCDGVVCNSTDTLTSIAKYASINCKLAVTHNGVVQPLTDNKNCQIPAASISVGYLANHYPLKGWKYFIDTIEHLVQNLPEMDIHIAGDGPYSNYIISCLTKIVSSSKLHVWGRLDSENAKASFFKSLDIFFCPTSPGTTSLEALSYGVPLFVAKHTHDIADGFDLDEFVSCGAAKLYMNLSPQGAASYLTGFYEQQKNINWEAVYQVLQSNYNWDMIASHTINLYMNVISNLKS